MSVKRFSSNVAVTVVAAAIVTVHVSPETVSQPLQPANVDRLSGVGVSVTVAPTSNSAAHDVPQSIPAGLEITLPVPVPARITESAARCRTVRVVLALAPEVSVTVIVVAPESIAVARPVPSIVATAGLLLVHVIPLPIIVTGVVVGVVLVVPLPSWPQSFAPQHFTVPSPRSAQL